MLIGRQASMRWDPTDAPRSHRRRASPQRSKPNQRSYYTTTHTFRFLLSGISLELSPPRSQVTFRRRRGRDSLRGGSGGWKPVQGIDTRVRLAGSNHGGQCAMGTRVPDEMRRDCEGIEIQRPNQTLLIRGLRHRPCCWREKFRGWEA